MQARMAARMIRRDFLKRAALAPAAVLGARLSFAADALGRRPARVGAVVFDERYSDCRIFADALAREGAVAFATGGNSANVWYGPLRAHLARYGGAVAGLTTDSDFVVSRGCGRELGLEMIFEGAHDCRESTRAVHRLASRAGDAREIAATLGVPSLYWAESLAVALQGISRRNTVRGLTTAELTTLRSGDHPGYLASWLLDSV